MNNYRDIIKSPVITEKSSDLAQNHNTIVFRVDPKANKTEIKQAIEKMKYEIANELGVNLGPDATSRANGSVGG